MNPSTARLENARTLAAALGLSDEEAGPLLDSPLQVTWPQDNACASRIGAEVVQLLTRTFSTIGTPQRPNPVALAELVIGHRDRLARTERVVYGDVLDDAFAIHYDQTAPLGDTASLHPLYCLLAACHASALLARAVLGEKIVPLPNNPVRLDFRRIAAFSTQELSAATINIGRSHLAGAGAIGNAVLHALRLVRASGGLTVIDPKRVTAGILNRCLWFEDADVGRDKAVALVERAQPQVPGVSLTSFVGTVAEFRERHGGEFERLIVAVDSRRTRRELQTEVPREVFDASTSGIEEVVVHHNVQPSELACLACIYEKTEGETTHERHVADMLNVSIVEIAQGFITGSAARQIAQRYPDLLESAIVGKAYDSLFRQLCATQLLRTADDRQVLAPFAFVSQLAGVLLVIELARQTLGVPSEEGFNYWRVSPWASPNLDLRQMRPRIQSCAVCARPLYRSLASELWA